MDTQHSHIWKEIHLKENIILGIFVGFQRGSWFPSIHRVLYIQTVVFSPDFSTINSMSTGDPCWVHPWRLTWNIIMEVWKIIFLSKWVICMFHVNLPGCNSSQWFLSGESLVVYGPKVDQQAFKDFLLPKFRMFQHADFLPLTLPKTNSKSPWKIGLPKRKLQVVFHPSIFWDAMLVSGRVIFRW